MDSSASRAFTQTQFNVAFGEESSLEVIGVTVHLIWQSFCELTRLRMPRVTAHSGKTGRGLRTRDAD